MTVTFNASVLNGRIKAAFDRMAVQLSDEFTAAIEEPLYDWPRGESPRDIVDEHKLAESQQQARVGALGMEYSWPREGDVSLLIHEGAVLNNGTVLPARRWTQVAISRRNPAEMLIEEYGRLP